MSDSKAALSRALLVLIVLDVVSVFAMSKLGYRATTLTLVLIGYGLIVFDGFFVLPKAEYAKRRVEYLGFGVVLTFLLYLTYVNVR